MSDRHDDRTNDRPKIEWVCGAASAILIVGVIAFLAFEAAFGDGKPPDLAATIERLEDIGNGTLVWVSVTNSGGEAAADVGVEAVVATAGAAPARKQLRFDYIAAHAVRRGAFLVQDRGVAAKDLQVTIHGFSEP